MKKTGPFLCMSLTICQIYFKWIHFYLLWTICFVKIMTWLLPTDISLTSANKCLYSILHFFQSFSENIFLVFVLYSITFHRRSRLFASNLYLGDSWFKFSNDVNPSSWFKRWILFILVAFGFQNKVECFVQKNSHSPSSHVHDGSLGVSWCFLQLPSNPLLLLIMYKKL